MFATGLPELIAQRGNAAEYPQNSLPALQSALELGVRHLEFDVQLSADRQPILLDHARLGRGVAAERNALDMTWEELALVSLHEPGRFAQGPSDIGIAKLDQAVELLAAHPDATAFVELKRASLRAFGHEIVVRKVCEVLKPVAQQCVLVSMDLATVHCVRQLSLYRIGWHLSEYTSLSALKCEALAPEFVICDHQSLTLDGAKLWRGPWHWAFYEVDSCRLALELAARGARLVGTNTLRSMLREYHGVLGSTGG